ncbi:MAG: Rho GTPase [Geoglossum umbratile]|nr:MAG: Rho GTPase [Geoglossum umbratile]
MSYTSLQRPQSLRTRPASHLQLPPPARSCIRVLRSLRYRRAILSFTSVLSIRQTQTVVISVFRILCQWAEFMQGIDLELFGGGGRVGGLFLEPVVAKTVAVLIGMAAQLERLLAEAGAVSTTDLPEVRRMRLYINSLVSILEDTIAMNDAEAAVLEAANTDMSLGDIAVAVENLAEMNNCLLIFTTSLTLKASAGNVTSPSRKKRDSITSQRPTSHSDQLSPDRTQTQPRHRHSRTSSSDKYLNRPDSQRPSKGKRARTANTKTPPRSGVTYITEPPKQIPKHPVTHAKVVLIGAGQCGKTGAISRFTTQKFSPNYVPTTISDHLATAGSLQGIQMTIIDTAGQDQYDRLRPLSYPDANVIVVCFSIGCRRSLSEVRDKWLPEYQHFAPTLPLVLLGLKSDLRPATPAPDEPRKRRRSIVSYNRGLNVAKAAGAVTYAECSAQSGHGVQEAFDMIADVAVGWTADRRGDSCVVM